MNSNKYNKRPLYISYAGPVLLETPLLNKGNAFSGQERQIFNLEGLLPEAIETIEEQASRAYQQFSNYSNDLNKHIYLRNIQDTNETLYFKLVVDNLQEMMPIIYTPTVGEACQLFSHIYRRKRGLFLSYPNRDRIDEILHNATKQNIKVIVVTDSERILGLGDQGIGGMGIPIGKLALYSACGGISPAYTLPVTIDVGTNNRQLLDDPMYMGWRHERICGEQYFTFVDQCLSAISDRWPNALIQFEDFALPNATPLLKKYQDKLCCFNDDIQGTAAVTVGTILAACRAQHILLKDQRIVFAGAGSAGCGIAEQIIAHMIEEGLTQREALERIYLCSSKGLLTDQMQDLERFQQKFAYPWTKVSEWSAEGEKISLMDVVRETKPGILIGVSGQPGLMTQEVIETLFENCPRPIILPLSNPNSRVEALPEDVLKWTKGQAIVATGSPFDPVQFNGQLYPIAQCNNAYIFPGIGLGVVASGAKRVTEKMFMVASETLASCSPLVNGQSNELLPALDNIRQVSKMIALAVGIQAMEEGVAEKLNRSDFENAIEANFWNPQYRDYRRTSF